MSNKNGASGIEKLTKAELVELVKSLSGDGEKPRTSSSEYLQVMSLVPYKLNLSTLPNGKGRLFSFMRFGEKKRIHINDLKDIIEHYRTFLELGFFYIMDGDFIEDHGLAEIYSRILDDDKIRKIVSCDEQDAVSLYSIANESQRHFVDELIIQRIADGESVDMNVVAVLSRIGKTDIASRAESRKNKLTETQK